MTQSHIHSTYYIPRDTVWKAVGKAQDGEDGVPVSWIPENPRMPSLGCGRQCSAPWSSPKTQDKSVSTAGCGGNKHIQRQKSCLGNLFLRCVFRKRHIHGITEDRILHELLAACVYLSIVLF